MPCRVDICPKCNQYDCECKAYGWFHSFDTAGALCDVLSSLPPKRKEKIAKTYPYIWEWYTEHRAREGMKP